MLVSDSSCTREILKIKIVEGKGLGVCEGCSVGSTYILRVAIRFMSIDEGEKDANENQEHSFAEADPNHVHNLRSRGCMASHHPNTNEIVRQSLWASSLSITSRISYILSFT